MIADALAGLRARRGRTVLAAAGVLAASLVVGTATTVGYSLATGFDRAAERSDLPDIVARFTRERRSVVDARVAALPNLEARSYRNEQPNRRLRFEAHRTRKGAVTAVLGGRRGYLIADGRDLRDGVAGETVIERGLAREWGISVGDRIAIEDLGSPRVVGIAVSPDNVAYPLASAARVYVTEKEFQDWFQIGRRVRPNIALLWLNDPAKADVTLTQARAVAFGLGKLQFITRTGVRVLLSQAAGIVISLLVAFSLVALVAAGTMLAAGAHAEVQRRLTAFGVLRALGFGPGRIAAQQAVEAAVVAVPAAAAGIALGALLVARPAGELLAALNEVGPGWALVAPLAAALAAVVTVVVAAATWPAWRAARRPPVEILRGGDLARRPRHGLRARLRRPATATATPPAAAPPYATASPAATAPRRPDTASPAATAPRRPASASPAATAPPPAAAPPPATASPPTAPRRPDTASPAATAPRRPASASPGPGGGLFSLGVRFATAARGRWLATVATVAVCAGVVTLMLALASLLERLREDPGTVGKRYQLAVALDPARLGEARRLPGVAAVGRRYSVDAADSFRLGEPVRLIAYPGDHTEFENPPLAEGRRIRGPNEVEVGAGLADALGLRPGSVLAAQIPDGGEVRFRVSGIVRALEHDGRIAWVRPDRLLELRPDLNPQVVVRLGSGADPAAVGRELEGIGARLQPVGAAQTDSAAFLAVLAAVLRGVGLAVGLVCLYALVQALTVTARERRGAVALLRACGADAPTVALVLAGAAVAVAVPAALLGVVLEAAVFGPLVARLAAGFASLPLAPTAGQVALVTGGLLLLAALATLLVARRVLREPVIAGLREE